MKVGKEHLKKLKKMPLSSVSKDSNNDHGMEMALDSLGSEAESPAGDSEENPDNMEEMSLHDHGEENPPSEELRHVSDEDLLAEIKARGLDQKMEEEEVNSGEEPPHQSPDMSKSKKY